MNSECMLSTIGLVKITDKDSGEVILNEKNAIHFGNMAWAIANLLAGNSTYHIKYVKFGNGASEVLGTGEILYKSANVSLTYNSSADLYNTTYQKNVFPNTPDNNIAVEVGPTGYSDVIVTCLLDYGEPAGQDFMDTATDFNGAYVFDEIGLVTDQENLLLTHKISHPVQKASNRAYEIEYTLRIQMTNA